MNPPPRHPRPRPDHHRPAGQSRRDDHSWQNDRPRRDDVSRGEDRPRRDDHSRSHDQPRQDDRPARDRRPRDDGRPPRDGQPSPRHGPRPGAPQHPDGHRLPPPSGPHPDHPPVAGPGHDHAESPEELIIAGRHEVQAALDSPTPPETVFLAASAHGPAIEAIRAAASRRQVKVQMLEPALFRRRFGEDAQGVTARAGAFAYADLETLLAGIPPTGPVLLLALHQVEDPRNLGAIVRTAEVAGVAGLLLPKHRAAGMTGGALRTAQGAAAWLPVARVTNLAQALEALKGKGFWIYGLEAGVPTRYDRASYPDRLVLVAGGEDAGLGRLVADRCDQLVGIPVRGRTGSLNVSVSTAVVLFEILRQQGFPGTPPKIS